MEIDSKFICIGNLVSKYYNIEKDESEKKL